MTQAPTCRVNRIDRKESHGDEGQEHEEEHGEEATAEDAEGEASGEERQEVAATACGVLAVAVQQRVVPDASVKRQVPPFSKAL